MTKQDKGCNRKRLIILTSLFFILALTSYFLFLKFSNKSWSCYLFKENSIGCKMIGEFSTKEDCLAAGRGQVQEENSFFCGRNCFIDAFVGDYAPEDVNCSEKIFKIKE